MFMAFKHTNSVESFWALLKRGIVGHYHKLSVKFLPKYIDESCYCHNNRDVDYLFTNTLTLAVGGKYGQRGESGKSII